MNQINSWIDVVVGKLVGWLVGTTDKINTACEPVFHFVDQFAKPYHKPKTVKLIANVTVLFLID